MRPSTYDDPFAIDDSAPADRPPPAARPLRKPATPYGIQPVPGGLVRAPGTPLDAGAAPAAIAATTAAAAPTAAGQPAGPTASAAAGTSPPASPPAIAASAALPPGAPLPAPAPLPPSAPISAPVSAPASASAGPGQPPPWLRRHEAFCHYFVLCGNASQAARQAGYSVPCAGNQGYRLLRRPEIAARIAAIRRGLAAADHLDHDVLLGKLEAVYERALEGRYLHTAARVVELQARIAGRDHGRARAATPVNDEK